MATIDDVARKAGVSSSTVSYALSGKRPISGPTRARVHEAIAALGYRPHAGARALASSKTNILALVVPLREAVDVNVIMQFVNGVVQGARQLNYDVLLITQEESEGVDRVLQGSMADAIIAMDIQEDDSRLTTLAAASIPAVLIGKPHHRHGLSCVDLDFEAAGTVLVDHLGDLLHEHIGILGAPQPVWDRHTSYLERLLRGARAQAQTRNLTLTAIPCPADEAGAYRAVDQILETDPEISGLIVHNESALPYVLGRLRALDKNVPDEISVVALSGTNTAENQMLPVSAVNLPAVEIGRAAVDLTIALLDGQEGAEVRLLPATLIQRATSTARQLSERT